MRAQTATVDAVPLTDAETEAGAFCLVSGSEPGDPRSLHPTYTPRNEGEILEADRAHTGMAAIDGSECVQRIPSTSMLFRHQLGTTAAESNARRLSDNTRQEIEDATAMTSILNRFVSSQVTPFDEAAVRRATVPAGTLGRSHTPGKFLGRAATANKRKKQT